MAVDLWKMQENQWLSEMRIDKYKFVSLNIFNIISYFYLVLQP